MPQALVDLFEAIEVDATNAHQRALPPGNHHRLPQPVFQQEPVG